MVNKRSLEVVKADYLSSGDTMAVVAKRHGRGERTLVRWSMLDGDGSWEDQRRRLAPKIAADLAEAITREKAARELDAAGAVASENGRAFEVAAAGLVTAATGMALRQVRDLESVWSAIMIEAHNLRLAKTKEVATKIGPMDIRLGPMDRLAGLRSAAQALTQCQAAMRKALGLDRDTDDGDDGAERNLRPALIPEKSDGWRGLVNE